MKYQVINNESDKVLFFITGAHEDDFVQSLIRKINCTVIICKVENWNDDLSPWPYHDLKREFKGNANKTIQEILNIYKDYQDKKCYIMGYSLAGLFSLYFQHMYDIFEGVISCSGSLWYPDFVDFSKNHPFENKRIYLSLGNKEEKTRHPVMSLVGKNTKELHAFYNTHNVCFFEYNQGNHFVDVEKRLLKGIKWMFEGESI